MNLPAVIAWTCVLLHMGLFLLLWIGAPAS